MPTKEFIAKFLQEHKYYACKQSSV